jgi:hypothetical protein
MIDGGLLQDAAQKMDVLSAVHLIVEHRRKIHPLLSTIVL